MGRSYIVLSTVGAAHGRDDNFNLNVARPAGDSTENSLH